MSADKILKMVETVDPEDTGALDEIDARIWCYCELHPFKHEFIGEGRNKSGQKVWMTKLPNKQRALSSWLRSDFPKYTRSRDALKAIRPEGWTWLIHTIDGNFRCILSEKPTRWCTTFDEEMWGFGKTEELAELQAIIQAIESERNND